MTNFMTKMQLRSLLLRSRQCSGHHKNDTHETPENLDTLRKNLQSIEIAGFSCIFNTFSRFSHSAFTETIPHFRKENRIPGTQNANEKC